MSSYFSFCIFLMPVSSYTCKEGYCSLKLLQWYYYYYKRSYCYMYLWGNMAHISVQSLNTVVNYTFSYVHVLVAMPHLLVHSSLYVVAVVLCSPIVNLLQNTVPCKQLCDCIPERERDKEDRERERGGNVHYWSLTTSQCWSGLGVLTSWTRLVLMENHKQMAGLTEGSNPWWRVL